MNANGGVRSNYIEEKYVPLLTNIC